MSVLLTVNIVAQVTTQHGAVLIIFPLNLQTCELRVGVVNSMP